MATRKARVQFAIKRFRGFWNQFKRSKRGLIGVIIIGFFSALAVFAPLLVPYEPIDPMIDPGEYPWYGGDLGPKIAEPLCKPSWYKDLPWISKGPIQLEQTYHSFRFGGLQEFWWWQAEFNRSYKKIDSNLVLSKAAFDPPLVEATFPNGSSRELVYSEEWTWNPKNPKNVQVYHILPEDTTIEVVYMSGSDITTNMELVPDYKFSSSQAFYSEWKWNASDFATVEHNSERGFEQDGCIEVAYSPKPGEASPQEVRVLLLKPFEYPYWEPPRSAWTHISAWVKGSTEGNAMITILFYEESSNTRFQIARFRKPVTTDWCISSHEMTNVFVGLYKMFRKPANLTLAVEVVLQGEDKPTVYIDNLNCILYGNSFGLLGTDYARMEAFPRDIYSMLVYGTRVSLVVGVLSALFGTVIGLFLGLVAGYIGGLMDEGIMRVADLLLVLPTLPLFIVLVVALKTVYGTTSLWNIIIILSLFGWMGFSRSVRSMVLSLRERPFVEAAKAAGAGRFYIINRHILPNVFALIYITLATSVPGAIVTEASLAWLGLGDPSVASWGKLLYDFQSSAISITRGLTEYWFWMFPACISIALLATAFILIGYALDEMLNPRLRQRR